jgi:hypothetical protein
MTALPPPKPITDKLAFGLIQTAKKFGNIGATGLSGGTVSCLVTAEADFDYVRIVYLNASSNSWTVSAAAVAPTAAPGDGFTPSGGNSSFVNATFNNAGAFGLPPSPGGSTSTVTVPAATGSGATTVYGMVASDWIPCPSLARTDNPSQGPNCRLLLVRTYAAAAMYGIKGGLELNYQNWQLPAKNLGRLHRTFWKSVNGVGTPSNFTSPTEQNNYGGVGMVVQFMSRTRGLSVVGVGDSLTQGHEYTANATATATIGGTITANDIVTLTFTNPAISTLPQSVGYTVLNTDTTTTIATALTTAINNVNGAAGLAVQRAGISATSSGAVVTIAQPGTTANSTVITSNVSGSATETVTLSNGGALSGGAGNTFFSDYDVWGHIACAAVSSSSCPVMWGNFGYGGQAHVNIYANAVNYVNNFTPDVLVFPCTSPNDGTLTQAVLDADWQRVTALALLCQSKGIHFVCLTPVPWGSSTPLTYVTQLQQRVLGAGYSCLDFFSLLQDGNSPPSVKPAYNSGDGHPNDAGYAAMAQLFQNLLQSLIAQKPVV